MNYMIVKESSWIELQVKVCAWIDKGYVPCGGLCAADGGRYYLQAMTFAVVVEA